MCWWDLAAFGVLVRDLWPIHEGDVNWLLTQTDPQETHTLCVFDQLPVVSRRRAKYKQMYGLKSTLTVSR